jgi:hypothetical protein
MEIKIDHFSKYRIDRMRQLMTIYKLIENSEPGSGLGRKNAWKSGFLWNATHTT